MDYHNISIIVPCYNEEPFIKKCLDSLLTQSYKGDIEIFVSDGMSTDRTRDIVSSMMAVHPNIHLLDNPGKYQSCGRNVALAQIKTGLVCYLDAHSYASDTWLENLYDSYVKLKQNNKRLAGVGSIHLDASETPFSYATTAAFNSMLGGSMITSYSAKGEFQKVNWAYACLYDKEILDTAGHYNPKLIKGEDLELNQRLTKKLGYDLYINPNAVTYYYKQENLDGLFTQMYNYGIWRYYVMHYMKMFTIINLAPAAMIFILLLLFISSLISPPLFLIWLFFILSYLGILFIYSLFSSLISGRNMTVLVLIYIAIHFGYGAGIIKGMFTKNPLGE